MPFLGLNKLFILKIIYILFFSINMVYPQSVNGKTIFQENSVFWKKKVDKLILENGDVFYGQFIRKEEEIILFKKEFEDLANSYKSSNIRHLVLANGQTIIRNNRDHRPVCYCLSLFTMLIVNTLSIK